jgi:hypothetical protein
MVMNVRDEEDILDANLRAHLALGVDFFLLVDHKSTDGTPEILRRYQEAGFAEVTRDQSDVPFWKREDAATELARRAAVDHGADWVIHNDADEFWWPLSGDLKAAFGQIPETYSALLAPRVEFVARPAGPGSFADRLTIRERYSRVRPKIAHRAHPEVYIPGGVHRVAIPGARGPRHVGRASLREGGRQQQFEDSNRWTPTAPLWPIRIFHFPVRGFDHFRRRVELGLFETRRQGQRPGGMLDAYEGGNLETVYGELILGADAVARGLETGELVEDSRLRDLLARCPDPISDPEGFDRFQPLADGIDNSDELAEVAQDAMQAMWRNEALADLATERLKDKNQELSELLRERRQQRRRSPWRRLRQRLGRAFGREPVTGGAPDDAAASR